MSSVVKSPYHSIVRTSESSSSSEKLSSNPSTTLHEHSESLQSPNTESERSNSLKKLSHFSDMKKSSEPSIALNFLKIENLKGDDPQHITIELPSIPMDIKTNDNLISSDEPNKNDTESPRNKYKRGLTLKVQNKYFVSENSSENETINFGEIIENDLNFNYKVFFEFFLMHLMFYVFVGPFASGFIALIWGGNLAKNQFFWGFNREVLLQTIEYMIIFLVIFPYYFYNFQNVYMIEIYMIIAAVLLRISIISIKYATMNEDKIKMLKIKEISHIDLKNEFTLRNFKAIDEPELEKELQTTIIRKDIDVALLLFRFLGDVNPDIKSQIQSDYNPFSIENEKNPLELKSERKTALPSKKHSLMSIISGSGNSQPSTPNKKPVSNSTIAFLNSSKVGKRMNLYNDFITDDDNKTTVYSGYHLAKLILKKGYNSTITPKWFLIIGIFISLIHAAIPSCYRLYDKGCFLGESVPESLLIMGAFLVNFYMFLMNLMFLMFGIYEFERQVRCLNQLSNLMASKKISLSDEKFTPTIDFFCKLSLKSWGSLHKIIRSFGAKYKLRVECYLTLFSLFYLVVLILVISSIFGNLDILSSFINLVILIFEILIMSLCMISLISIGVVINKQYQIHKGLIKTNKDVISDLLRLYVVYFEKKEYRPENEIYRKGVEKVEQNVNYYLTNNITICNPKRWMHDELKKKITKRILKDLISICDEIIEELNFESMYEPFRINGITATPKVLHSIFAIFGSLLFAVGQKYINNFMH